MKQLFVATTRPKSLVNGINRLYEFIKSVNLNIWLVNKFDGNIKVDIHQTMNQDIEY
ncbi:hypothetical protein JMI89_02170 [Frischella sp. Ac48]|uniref:hypothetical protein n=1 Tax=Frischella sp. Ac48 TaxID=2804531 RepID=UPI001C7D9A10|nr:hypothetical protein [Frischella sp. Ac48]MBX4132434.1 hypothetical protein [Frischella sp. Ac48]